MSEDARGRGAAARRRDPLDPPDALDPLLDAARRWPARTALLAGEERIDYRTLAARAAAAAHALRRLGVEPGHRVALLAADGAETIVLIHAVRLAGAALVPLQRRAPAPELEPLVRRVRPTLLVHDATTAPVASAVAAATAIRLVDCRALETAVDEGGGGPARLPASPRLALDDPGAILFTSGTTGLPRAALLSHRALMASARAWNAFLEPRADDRWLATLPLAHVAGLGIVLRAALAGLPIVVHERFDPIAVLRDLAQAKVSHVSLVPTQVERLLEAAGPGPIAAPALRALLLGGAPIPPELVRRALGRGLPIVPTYGLTEAASGVTALPAAEAAAFPGSSGRPLPGLRLRILRDDGGEARPGEVGEIVVAGPTLFDGYVDDPEATARVLRGGWLHSGDLGSLDVEGRLVVAERRIDWIISGGENVSPTEVELVLATHAEVAEAVVVGRPDPLWGSIPVAAVTLRPGGRLAEAPAETVEAELVAFARERLAPFKVPKRIVRLDAIPRTGSGKVRRPLVAELIERAEATSRTEPGGAPRAGSSSGRVSGGGPGPSMVGEPTIVEVSRPDGTILVVRRWGSGPLLLLLHATLSRAADYDALAARLAADVTVLAVDRRSAGASRERSQGNGSGRTAEGDALEPIDVGVHVEDLVAVLGAVAGGASGGAAAPLPPALVVGHSFGGVVGLELAARRPDLVAGLWLFEPPYVPAAPAAVRRAMAELGDRLRAIVAREGIEAAGPAFLAAVAGVDPSQLSEGARRRAAAEAPSALADAALRGLDPGGLRRIAAPVTIALGERSPTWYRATAMGLARHITGMRLVTLPGLDHLGPLKAPDLVAEAIADWLGKLRSG
ncbi:MAG TPA: o-succinylbenzoate--CoA ligase [Candidatus Binatia bacterium]|nr:o-succinylbenzoate--CoA ligase [Candidatus Binatia bacterium]